MATKPESTLQLGCIDGTTASCTAETGCSRRLRCSRLREHPRHNSGLCSRSSSEVRTSSLTRMSPTRAADHHMSRFACSRTLARFRRVGAPTKPPRTRAASVRPPRFPTRTPRQPAPAPSGRARRWWLSAPAPSCHASRPRSAACVCLGLKSDIVSLWASRRRSAWRDGGWWMLLARAGAKSATVAFFGMRHLAQSPPRRARTR